MRGFIFASPRHGTSKDAAEKIARTDFYVPVGKDMKHAARFGNGAYLAEDVEKSWRGRNGPERALDRLFRTISVAKLYQNSRFFHHSHACSTFFDAFHPSKVAVL